MLVHKSIDVRPEVWKRLRVNAELSGVAVRDYLSYLIEQAKPVPERDAPAQELLRRVAETNSSARKLGKILKSQSND